MASIRQEEIPMAIFIDSFDGMSDVWKYYFKIFNKYWPDCKFNRYLVTNNKDYTEKNLSVIKTGNEKNWFAMTYKGLCSIKEKYIFFMLEDDFMSKTANNEAIAEILDYMESNNIYFYRFTCPLTFPKNQGFLPVYGDVVYPLSIQPAIWERRVLLGYLKDLQNKGCKSPWDFERFFIEEYKNYDRNKQIPCIRYDSRDLFGFTNGIIQGKWDPRIVRLFTTNGIFIDTKERGVMTFRKVLMDEVKRNKFIRSMSFEKQAKVKKLLKKIGLDFIT